MGELMHAAPYMSSNAEGLEMAGGEEADVPRGPDEWPEWMTGGFVPPTHADDQGSAADCTESEGAEANSDEEDMFRVKSLPEAELPAEYIYTGLPVPVASRRSAGDGALAGRRATAAGRRARRVRGVRRPQVRRCPPGVALPLLRRRCNEEPVPDVRSCSRQAAWRREHV